MRIKKCHIPDGYEPVNVNEEEEDKMALPHICNTKSCRLATMLALTASYFLVEIIVGYVTNSIALVADSFHMLSDVVALVIGLLSVRISKWQTEKNTFGWARAEVLGAMVNAVFLCALTFSIFIEALKRLISVEKIDNPKLLLIVGCVGLAINLLGLALFSGHAHGHSHGGGGGHGHGHSHGGGHSHSQDSGCDGMESPYLNGVTVTEIAMTENDSLSTATTPNSNTSENNAVGKKKKTKSSGQLNMRGVFLHVMGDALGSVVVVISALVIWFGKGDWKYYLDPCMSLIMVTIILSTTIPLLKESAMILLQTVPEHMKAKEISTKLIEKVEGVLAVHEFHIWQLAGNRIIASAHIRCRSLQDYMRVAESVKEFFHNEGIHSTTIQPEFSEFYETAVGRDCVLECGPEKICYMNTCCGSKKDLQSIASSGTRQRLPGSHNSAAALSVITQAEGKETNAPKSL